MCSDLPISVFFESPLSASSFVLNNLAGCDTAPWGSGGGILSYGLPNAFAALAPFEAISTLRMALFFAANEDVIRFNAAVS